ncbi:MAG: hypothetical protein ABIG92_06930 [Candidatus Omnitrophota bacterium]
MRQIISRLEADSRLAEVLVTGVNYDEKEKKNLTTIKFLEYDSKGQPLEAKYFTFSGNIIQFQSLVIRFDDIHVRSLDRLKGKSAYIFLKAFMLDGANTEEYEITSYYNVPDGYRIEGSKNIFEEKLWNSFWEYALDEAKRKKTGIKNAQIEAPGNIFVPGMLYTLKIEHDGGIRIDQSQLPNILRGEKLL